MITIQARSPASAATSRSGRGSPSSGLAVGVERGGAALPVRDGYRVKAELRRFGNSRSPVAVIDGFSGDSEGIAALAEGLAPFPLVEHNYYPGLRRVITDDDRDAMTYVSRTCQQAAQFIGGAFDVDGFDLLEASVSMVTLQPAELSPPQRAPHFDSQDP